MRDVFVSRPTALQPDQLAFMSAFEDILQKRGVRGHTLGVTDYPNVAPVSAVVRLMAKCDGAVVLGLRQLKVASGVDRPGTPRERRVRNSFLATPWNQLEAGIAIALEKPLLVLREPGISGGIFDAGATDRFVHQLELASEWLSTPAFYQPLSEWLAELGGPAGPAGLRRGS